MDYLATLFSSRLLFLVEQGYVPDALLRVGMRRLMAQTLAECAARGAEATDAAKFAAKLRQRPVAEATEKANEQHYEVDADFYSLMLGPRFKYSCAVWPRPDTTLAEAEEAMLALTCERAGVGLPEVRSILDMGCGWGSLTLYVLEKFPNVRVTCVSNSNSQREFILAKAAKLGASDRLSAHTMDANVMEFPPDSFDRVVSVEMFEHMKNYEVLFGRIAKWLKPGGKLFFHVFTHYKYSYHFQDGWMSENFFTGGTMPSQDLYLEFQRDLTFEQRWTVNGQEYSKTLEAWLQKLDENKDKVLPVLGRIYGKGNEYKWYMNWRLFNMACSELFNLNGGTEYPVTHYLFSKPVA